MARALVAMVALAMVFLAVMALAMVAVTMVALDVVSLALVSLTIVSLWEATVSQVSLRVAVAPLVSPVSLRPPLGRPGGAGGPGLPRILGGATLLRGRWGWRGFR